VLLWSHHSIHSHYFDEDVVAVDEDVDVVEYYDVVHVDKGYPYYSFLNSYLYQKYVDDCYYDAADEYVDCDLRLLPTHSKHDPPTQLNYR
jgi:hypothetical protein